MTEVTLFCVRKEGGLYERISSDEWARIMASDEKPCAVGIATEWRNVRDTEQSPALPVPSGWAYDFIVAKRSPQVSPWRRVGADT